jgi:hypothetical protein
MKALSIKEILEDDSITSNYQGSSKTKEMVEEQIRKIYGDKEVRNYNPYKNALTFASWIRLGYRPKKGSKALKSITYVEKKDAEGNVISKYPRKINLFYYRSVEPIKIN